MSYPLDSDGVAWSGCPSSQTLFFLWSRALGMAPPASRSDEAIASFNKDWGATLALYRRDCQAYATALEAFLGVASK